MSALYALSPVDGRYQRKAAVLSPYFSEFALIQYRVRVEVEYFIALVEQELPQLADFPQETFPSLRAVYQNFGLPQAEAIKAIERTTNHDVKAVEYFLKEQWEALGLGAWKEFIHFGLTSQDVNNTAIPLSLKEAMHQVMEPQLTELSQTLHSLAVDWKHLPMMAYTHGQPASPTRLGKEIQVFVERLERQLVLLGDIPFSAKFGGATGNFNAHQVAYPSVDWVAFGNDFVEDVLGLSRSQFTTQIEHYDHLAALCDGLKRINTILIDLCRDIWQYISMGYFRQKLKEGEVGSSAMPHKVNPIDFENAEGNLGLANALFEHLAAKLPISRLQRDLTDSTVLRNLGVPLAHSLIAYQSILTGLGKLIVSEQALAADLAANPMVVAEAIQTILRREGVEQPYEKLKALTRGKAEITLEDIDAFIQGLGLSAELTQELLAVRPENYTGVIPEGL